MCVAIGGKLQCSMPCCDSSSCGAIVQDMKTSLLACEDVDHAGAVVRACAKVLPPTATGAVGATCSKDEDCRGGFCLATDSGEMQCSDACCTDASCADPAFSCRPRLESGKWALRCARK
jgi:hypothetical protein